MAIRLIIEAPDCCKGPTRAASPAGAHAKSGGCDEVPRAPRATHLRVCAALAGGSPGEIAGLAKFPRLQSRRGSGLYSARPVNNKHSFQVRRGGVVMVDQVVASDVQKSPTGGVTYTQVGQEYFD